MELDLVQRRGLNFTAKKKEAPMKSEVKLLDFWNSDREIAESAWASTQKKERTEGDVYRVITQSIVPLQHDTPKEAVWFRFWIRCPIYVERQLDKYRMSIQKQDFRIEYEQGGFGRLGITQNELSLRYRTMPNDYIERPEDIENILKRIDDTRAEEISLADAFYNRVMNFALTSYQMMVEVLRISIETEQINYQELKRVREFFRGVLGTGFFTDMQIICNLNALEHILNQRLAPEAQPEAREVARLMLDEVEAVCPIAITEMIKINNWKDEA